MLSLARTARMFPVSVYGGCAVVLSGVALPAAALLAQTPREQTELVSVMRGSHEAVGTDTFEGVDVSVSADGRYVVFQSDASTIVANDHNNSGDVFVRDRSAGTSERVSVDSHGNEGNFDSYGGFSISADGRFVAFGSLASNLVPGDTNGASDIFVRDRVTGRTERVSLASDGSQANLDSSRPSISADGRYVAFESAASNLTTDDDNGGRDVFVRDRRTGLTERASIDVSGAEGVLDCLHASIDANGRYVGFVTTYQPLGLGRSVWLRDRQARFTELISVGAHLTNPNESSDWPAVSASGRFVAFESIAAKLVADDHNDSADVFLRDRQTGQTELVSVDSSGRQGNAPSGNASISAQGRFIAFESAASNLVSNDRNDTYDVFVRDRETGRTERASVDSSGAEDNGSSFRPSLNADGRFVAFDSTASDLAADDYNRDYDVYVHHNVHSAEPVAFTIKPGVLAFGAQELSSPGSQSFWLRNTGTMPITSIDAHLRGTDAALFHIDQACPNTVAVGGGCKISITFAPVSTGPKTAVLQVIANGELTRTRYLTGTAVQAAP